MPFPRKLKSASCDLVAELVAGFCSKDHPWRENLDIVEQVAKDIVSDLGVDAAGLEAYSERVKNGKQHVIRAQVQQAMQEAMDMFREYQNDIVDEKLGWNCGSSAEKWAKRFDEQMEEISRLTGKLKEESSKR